MGLNNFSEIATFVSVVNAGSFTVAAGQVGLTRSAVGKSIARLEERLQVRLLNRSSRSLSLTDDGKAFFDRCVQILDDLEQTEEAMAQRSTAPHGRLRISVPSALGHKHLLPVLATYLEAWPQVSVNVSFADRYVDLVDEGVDVALRIGGPRVDSSLIARTVAHERLMICAAPAYLERRGTPRTVDALNAHECLFFANGSRPTPWTFKGADGAVGSAGRLQMNSAQAIQEMALAGLGVANLPTYLIEDDLRSGRLVPLLRNVERDGDPIRVLYPARQHLSPKVRLFIDLLAARWTPQAPWDIGT
ncbi:LysR family transcriptional regulator [Rugamonas sp.]|uniref:LysR family transcriptional regulator n=1 Tax=Rugamonas sp. TaxID=1926287 RepID=UPI0025ED9FB7|nr:LysR family transcriptional regulator [Rugamonas sp.]